MRNLVFLIICVSVTIHIQGHLVDAQTTEFTYQGNLKDGANPANGNYDFEFALFDTLTAGTQIGSTLTRSAVSVSAGTFAVKLDFGSQFPGANRFLEVRVRTTGGGAFISLSPRHQVVSAPYSIKAINADNAVSATNAANAINATLAATATNATQLGGIAANQYVLTGDSRMSDARNPLPNSSNYIQNTTSPQATSNFNISGNGTVGGTLSGNIFNAVTQFNLNGSRVLSAGGTNNFFAGIGAGSSNTGGVQNSFFGRSAGLSNSTGVQNSFFGFQAGTSNLVGGANAFFGTQSGNNNTQGSNNSFYGFASGALTTTGNNNTFIGDTAGLSNTTGSNNAILGASANVGANNLSFATAIGAGSTVSASNTITLGRSNGSDTVLIPGNLNIVGTYSGNLPTGSPNYIQNGTLPQAASNFNISGTGTANILKATTQFDLGSSRILSIGGSQNTFLGIGAGAASIFPSENNSFFGFGAGQLSTTSAGNSFFGTNAGFKNSSGGENSFFGSFAGENNTTSNSNSFFGTNSGNENTSGSDNSFFGRSAGSNNTVGGSNSYFGVRSGLSNISSSNNSFFGFESGRAATAAGNSFFGFQAGRLSTTGVNNTFVGLSSGLANTVGSNNTLLGANANLASPDLVFATAIGAGAIASDSATVVLGRSGDKVAVPGRLEVDQIEAPGVSAINFPNPANFDSAVDFNGNVRFFGGIGNVFPSGGATPICSIFLDVDLDLRRPSKCSSSRRYKTNINPFAIGLDLVRKLRPVSFNWKADGMADLGLIAEDVADVEPLLVTTNKNGEAEGVKYERIGVVLVNAVKEQQTQIESQQKRIDEQKIQILLLQEKLDRQQSELDALKSLVCQSSPQAAVCKEKE